MLERIERAAARLRDDAEDLPRRWLIEITFDQPAHEQVLGHPVFLHGVADVLEHHVALCRATGTTPSPEAAHVADLILGQL